jgi:hypothetical protein
MIPFDPRVDDHKPCPECKHDLFPIECDTCGGSRVVPYYGSQHVTE